MGYFVADHNGTPTIFKDGNPIFYGLMWGSAPSPGQLYLKGMCQAFLRSRYSLLHLRYGNVRQSC